MVQRSFCRLQILIMMVDLVFTVSKMGQYKDLGEHFIIPLWTKLSQRKNAVQKCLSSGKMLLICGALQTGH